MSHIKIYPCVANLVYIEDLSHQLGLNHVCVILSRLCDTMYHICVYCRAMAGPIEGQRQVLEPMRVDLCVPRVPSSHFCCIECKNIAYIKGHVRRIVGPWQGPLKDQGGS